jgi:hypothetical protein
MASWLSTVASVGMAVGPPLVIPANVVLRSALKRVFLCSRLAGLRGPGFQHRP